MNRCEKVAWFNFAVLIITVAVFLILIPLLGIRPAAGAFGLLGLWGLGFLFYRKKQGISTVILDERDLEIQRKAMIIGHSVFWVLFVLVCMLLWGLNKGKGTVSAEVFPMMVLGGWAVVMFVQSLVTLIMYRTGKENAAG